MTLLRFALSALVAVSAVQAASNSCSTSGTTTINGGGDASAIATACSTYTGVIAVATDASGPVSFTGGKLKRIEGSLRFVNTPNVSTVAADMLTTIDDEFRLDGVQGLDTLTIPELTSCGSIFFNALSQLQNFDPATDIQSVGALTVQNTKLSTLEGLNLKEATSININNNPALQNVTNPLKNITGSIMITANNERAIVAFPNLVSAGSVSLADCASIDLSKLQQVGGMLSFKSNNYLVNLTCPALTATQGSMAINSNDQLKSISFPQLVTVKGALDVQNNTNLGSINFPKLQTIKGTFDAYGAFTSVKMPALKQVSGGFNVQTSKTLAANTCSNFENEQGASDVIQGKLQCADHQAHPSNANSAPTGTSAVKGSSFANPAALPSMYTGVFGVLAAIFGML